MVSMQNSLYTDVHGSVQDDGSSGSPTIPTLTRIDARASISSSSTGASPDDTSTDSPIWAGSDRSPPADLDVQMNPFVAMPDAFGLDPHAKFSDMDMDAPAKVEDLDDEDIQSIKPSDVTNDPEDNAGAPAAVPRKRGRPRKHPLPAPGGQLKVTKGRSKTGCITCRRRKKKCDETKPA